MAEEGTKFETLVVASGSKLGGMVTLQKRTWTNFKDRSKNTYVDGEIYAIIDTTQIDQPQFGEMVFHKK